MEVDILICVLGDLYQGATEDEIQNAFANCGSILEVRVIRDKMTQQCKGYGFIHFATEQGKKEALSSSRPPTVLGGRVLRVKDSEQKLTVFVGNLPMSNTAQQIENGLKYILSQVPDIDMIGRCFAHQKVVPVDSFTIDIKTNHLQDGRPRGFGFIHATSSSGRHTSSFYVSHSIQVAEAAKTFLTGVVLNTRAINVSWAESTGQDTEADKTATTLYVANLVPTPFPYYISKRLTRQCDALSEDILRLLFSQFGEPNKCVIMKQPQVSSIVFPCDKTCK